jgi:hypothetical protein
MLHQALVEGYQLHAARTGGRVDFLLPLSVHACNEFYHVNKCKYTSTIYFVNLLLIA